MSEKENSEQENEEFASAVLLVAIAVYIAITAALFAGMMVKYPDAATAIAEWARDYGAIIAGIPVLIAVWFAKQQLDANRRQHVATIKRSFRAELDALNQLEEFALRLIKVDEGNITPWLGKAGFLSFSVIHPSQNEIEAFKGVLPEDITSLASEALRQLILLTESTRKRNAQFKDVKENLNRTQYYSNYLYHNVRVHHKELSQYWS